MRGHVIACVWKLRVVEPIPSVHVYVGSRSLGLGGKDFYLLGRFDGCSAMFLIPGHKSLDYQWMPTGPWHSPRSERHQPEGKIYLSFHPPSFFPRMVFLSDIGSHVAQAGLELYN